MKQITYLHENKSKLFHNKVLISEKSQYLLQNIRNHNLDPILHEVKEF